MKWLFLSFLAATLIGCETVPTTYGKHKARVTCYYRGEDKWGNRIASSNQKAKEGRTIAAEKAFSFGKIIYFPLLQSIFGEGHRIVEDRGSAIESRKASQGLCPVFDLYC